MEAILGLANPACQESALHGLGHAARQAPERIGAIIGAFLEREALRPEILAYARSARSGCIL